MRRKLIAFWVLVSVGLLGSVALWSQRVAERRKLPPRAGTIPALLEKTVGEELSLGIEVDYPTYSSIEALASAGDIVIRGRVVAMRGLPCNEMRFVCTQFRVKVIDTFWGTIPPGQNGKDRVPDPPGKSSPRAERGTPAPDEIVVSQAGGALSMNGKSVRAWEADQRLLSNGKDYILFLKWIPASRATTLGSETYLITGGPQGALEVSGSTARSMLSSGRHDHPIRFEVEALLKGDVENIRSHLGSRRPRIGQ